MTFKHIDFNSSPTMRSLTKVAQDKGWIKDEPVVKTASPKLDLKPSDNLTENLLKLCGGLRAAGFEKQADEIEDKFVVYKQANSLYGVSGEDGDDLLHSAHPKGSHKMEDVDSKEAVFEDLLDKHQQFVSMVDKKPTGKLASTRSIINAVKIALGASMSDIKSALSQVAADADKIITIAEQGGGLTDTVLNWGKGRAENIRAIANKDHFTLNDINSVESNLDAMERNFHPNALHNWLPDLLNKGVSSDEIWSKLEGFFSSAHQQISMAQETIKTIALDGETAPAPGTPGGGPLQMREIQTTADPVIGKGTTLVNTLKAYQSVGKIARNPAAINWIKSQIKEIQDVMTRFNSAEATGQLNQVKSSLEQEMDTKESEVKDFYSKVAGV